MAIRTRMELIDRNIVFTPGGGLATADIAAALAAFAGVAIAEADAANSAAQGRLVPRTTFVDGVASTDLKQVRPDGVIVAEWQFGGDLVRWIFDQIVQNAPQLTGAFVKSQRIYADGTEVATPEAAAAATEVVILSVVPYARKIESGQSRKAPNGVYEAVAALAAQRFGNTARIRFTFREPVGGATPIEQWAGARSARIAAVRKRRAQRARDTRQPAIVITFR